jgi:ADP-ribose pyrophosphatase
VADDGAAGDRVIYRGLKIDLALRPVALRDGSVAEREVVLHRGAVALVPMVDEKHVCLIRNRRYSIGKTLLEVPAGTIDAGEDPDTTAARELTEETGFIARRIQRVREWFVSPGDERTDVLVSLRGFNGWRFGSSAGRRARECGCDVG